MEGRSALSSATAADHGDPLWVGIDIGTQSVRVVLLDERGTPVGHGSAPLSSRRAADGRHEQDPADWWSATVSACARATAGVDAGHTRAVAVCSTSGTILLADGDGEPRTPALMYDDDRGASHVQRVVRAGGELWDELGLSVQASWALPKLLWLLDHGDALAGARLMHAADFVAARLAGGPVATDSSHALKTGYDSLRGGWPDEVLERAGVPLAMLPPVAAPGATIGEICPAGARATGLPAGARIVAGMTDGCAGQIAAGQLESGSAVSVLGTTLVLKTVTAELLRDPHGAVYCHRHPDGGWLPGGASNVGAGVLSTTFPGRDLGRLDDEAKRHEPAGAAVYPLSGRGERFPFYRPDAESVQVGTSDGEADHYAALLQGVAFAERLGFAALARLGAPVTGSLALTGGATRSRYWSQLRVDVLDREVELPRHPESAVGMAILAAAGDGSVTEAARRLVPPGERIAPRRDAADRLAERFEALLDALVERGYVDAELAAAASPR